MNPPALSIVVCTHNRATLLARCLESLAAQTACPEEFEVIVVDNHSTDKTAECAAAFVRDHPHFRYVFEGTLGVCQARNRGWQEARGAYVAYIDDDARAFPDFAERVLAVAATHDFACWGGFIISEFESPRPAWLSEQFGSNIPLFARYTQVSLLHHGEVVWGSAMVFRRQVLERCGGFNTAWGKRGEERVYGEEDELQNHLRAAGYEIGFDPGLRVHHLVSARYSRLRGHWPDFYGGGYASTVHLKGRSILVWLLRRRLSHLYYICRGGVALVARKDYYWQNFALDVIGPLVRDYGVFRGWVGRSRSKVR